MNIALETRDEPGEPERNHRCTQHGYQCDGLRAHTPATKFQEKKHADGAEQQCQDPGSVFCVRLPDRVRQNERPGKGGEAENVDTDHENASKGLASQVRSA